MNVPGADDLVKMFGRWPSFHDAEVVRFILERTNPNGVGPIVSADVHVFEMTDEVASNGTYVLKNHTLVSFRFSGVDELILDSFNQQNVLQSLRIVDISDRQLELLRYEIKFDSLFGMGARFLCQKVWIETISPCDDRGESVASPRVSPARPGRAG